MANPIQILCEVDPLKRVIVHRPGKELLHLIPDNLEKLLFDDLLYLEKAQEEHDIFTEALKRENVEVIFLEDLMSDILENEGIRHSFIEDYILEAKIPAIHDRKRVQALLSAITNPKVLVEKTMSGILKSDLAAAPADHLSSLTGDGYPFITDPMVNLYFARDAFCFIGNGVAISHMRYDTRARETIYGRYLLRYHPVLHDEAIRHYYDADLSTSLEGGDIMMLDAKTLAVGISERTDSASVEKLAYNLFQDGDSSIEKVMAFQIPQKRAFMHLDTVMTMLDYDKFLVHSAAMKDMHLFILAPSKENDMSIYEELSPLKEALEKHLGVAEIMLIECGDGDPIAAAREQWYAGTNALAVAPGKVIVFDRNIKTNEALRRDGIEVLEIPSSELGRGHGGPHCMCMPLLRSE